MKIDSIISLIGALGAGGVLWTLLLLGLLGLAIIVERAVCFWTTRDDIPRLAAELGRLVRGRQWQRLLSESPSFEARVVLAAVGRDDPESADQLMLGASQSARVELERCLPLLWAVGSNAPIVGLLGTVASVIGSLQELGSAQGACADCWMGLIGEALLATAAGLIVALPALAAFTLFRGVVQARLARADALRRVVLGQLHARRAA